MTTVLHSPDNGSTAAVLLNGPLGRIFIQALDAYGFQRELILSELPGNDSRRGFGTDHILKAYMHSGRRDEILLTAEEAAKFVEWITERCEGSMAALLFNVKEGGAGRARCNGFVHLCESIHRGDTLAEIMERL